MRSWRNISVAFASLFLISNVSEPVAAMVSANDNKLRTVVNSRGWTLVKEAEQRAINLQVRKSTKKVNGLDIVTKSTRIEDDYFTTNQDFFLLPNSVMKVYTYDVTFYRISRFSFQGRQFGIRVELGMANAATKSRAGAIVTYCFVDYDGDGILETREEKEEISSVPDWVTRGSD